jgi:hypothetical protein
MDISPPILKLALPIGEIDTALILDTSDSE